MTPIVIGGYLKSGTTWLKFIVASIVYNTNNPKVVERKIPNVQSPSEKHIGTFYKTHVVNPPDGKALYILRHPVDICISGINHLSLSGKDIDKDKYVSEFISKDANTISNFGTWQESVINWTNKEDCKIIKYEDLLRDTKGHIRLIGDYVKCDMLDIDRVLNDTSFKTMKTIEKNGVASSKKNVADVFYNPKHKGYKRGRMFINRGKSGYALEVITKEQIKLICEHFNDAMAIAGYSGYAGIC